MTDEKSRTPQGETDPITGVGTTGHEWDGIKEYNNPLPRWWLWTFIGTVVVGAVITVLYPAWPMLGGPTAGVLGYSSRSALNDSLSEARAAHQADLDRIAALPVTEIAADPALSRFAANGGASAFKVYCIQCHGTGAAGAPGYPNLNDDEWIWGGTIDDIYKSIALGIRSGEPGGRSSKMPTFGADRLAPEQVQAVALYVGALSGLDGGKDTPEGAQLYADNCAGCHRKTGEGFAAIGAPNISDKIWLYAGSVEAIAAQISAPRHGAMPAWTGRLGDGVVKQLAVYVHGLGGGK